MKTRGPVECFLTDMNAAYFEAGERSALEVRDMTRLIYASVDTKTGGDAVHVELHATMRKVEARSLKIRMPLAPSLRSDFDHRVLRVAEKSVYFLTDCTLNFEMRLRSVEHMYAAIKVNVAEAINRLDGEQR